MRGMFLGFHELRACQGGVSGQITPLYVSRVVWDPLEGGVGVFAGFWGKGTGAGEAEKPQKRRFAGECRLSVAEPDSH